MVVVVVTVMATRQRHRLWDGRTLGEETTIKVKVHVGHHIHAEVSASKSGKVIHLRSELCDDRGRERSKENSKCRGELHVALSLECRNVMKEYYAGSVIIGQIRSDCNQCKSKARKEETEKRTEERREELICF